MSAEIVNRISRRVLIVLSLTALLTVLLGFTQPRQPAPVDEGTGAHIFQLSIVAMMPVTLLFFATADWKQPWRSVRPLAFSAATISVAFALLYCLEHYYFT
jgi:hypothetical protein